MSRPRETTTAPVPEIAGGTLPTRNKVLMAEAWLAVLDGLDSMLYEAGGQLEVEPNDSGGRYRNGRVLDGVRAVHDQAVDMMNSLGYRRHAETGVPFDPQLHDVVRVDRDTGELPGIVVEVLRPGYGEGEERLRPASVAVAGGDGTGA